MSILGKVLSLFSMAPLMRTPEERKLDHTLQNFEAAMQGAKRRAHRISEGLKNSPKASELQELRAQSESTIDAIVRDMQGRKR